MEINKNIKGDKLHKLFSIVNEKADKISIERYCDEKIKEDEFKIMQEDYIKYLKKEDIVRRKNYDYDLEYRNRLKRIGINTYDEANAYFNELLEQDLDVANCISNDGEDRVVKEIDKDVIEKRYTRITCTTKGPIMQQYFLKKGEILQKIEKSMKNLFDFPYCINGEEYENLTFYSNDKPIFCICSHEKYAISYLEEIINQI